MRYLLLSVLVVCVIGILIPSAFAELTIESLHTINGGCDDSTKSCKRYIVEFSGYELNTELTFTVINPNQNIDGITNFTPNFVGDNAHSASINNPVDSRDWLLKICTPSNICIEENFQVLSKRIDSIMEVNRTDNGIFEFKVSGTAPPGELTFEWTKDIQSYEITSYSRSGDTYVFEGTVDVQHPYHYGANVCSTEWTQRNGSPLCDGVGYSFSNKEWFPDIIFRGAVTGGVGNGFYYYYGENIDIAGTIENAVSNKPLSIVIYDPMRKIVVNEEVEIDSDGKFSTSIIASGDAFRTNGEYTLFFHHSYMRQPEPLTFTVDTSRVTQQVAELDEPLVDPGGFLPELVGLPDPTVERCGEGTVLVNGVCQLAPTQSKTSFMSIEPLYIIIGVVAIGGIIGAIAVAKRGSKTPKPAKQELDEYEEQYPAKEKPKQKPVEKKETSAFCENCGNTLNPKAKFCGSCGTAR